MALTPAQRLDNVANRNAFLAMIGGQILEEPSEKEVTVAVAGSDQLETPNNTETTAESVAAAETQEDASDESGDATSPVGDRRPLPSDSCTAPAGPILSTNPHPLTVNNLALASMNLDDSGAEVLSQIAAESDLTLKDSNFAKLNTRFQPRIVPGSYPPRPAFDTELGPRSADLSIDNRPGLTSVQIELLAKMAKAKEAACMEDTVLANFRARNAHIEADWKVGSITAEAAVNNKENNPPKRQLQGAVDYDTEDKPTKTSDTVPFPKFEDSEDTGVKLPSAPTFSPQATDFIPSTPPSAGTDNINTGKASPQNEAEDATTLDNAKARLANKVASLSGSSRGAGSPTIVVTCSTDSEADIDEDEDRENMKTFSTWGTPQARNKPAARVRKVVLTGFPVGSDLTLVQSLISGGATETFSLSPSGSTAYVTFISGDACDSFYEKYPNGITFKHKGKTQTVFVDKAKEVDVVSGMLQGWLDCGASRCVRAVGADADWGMGALHKLAFGKSRKVEHITDTFRNNVRTIVFRFASIADAVQFKGILVRDIDWEEANIQFMDDPCEKAAGVHLE